MHTCIFSRLLHSGLPMQTGSEIIEDLPDLGILVTGTVCMLQWRCNPNQSALVEYQQLQTGCWLAGWTEACPDTRSSPGHGSYALSRFMQHIQLNWN